MAVFWPAYLPQVPQLAGYQAQVGMSVMTSETDRGPPKRRSLTDFTPHPTTFQMVMTHHQWNQLIGWFRYSLANGALSFFLTDPLDGLLHTFCFTDGPSGTPDDDPMVMKVTLNVIRMD